MKDNRNFYANRITRRGFIKGAVATGALLTLPTDRVLGANNDIRVAVIGCGGKGAGHLNQFPFIDGVRVVAVSDPDLTHMDKAVAKLEKNAHEKGKKLSKIAKHQDFRRIIDDPSIDAIVIATPNHWHSLITIMACQAGKDVYVEKPISHTLWEGRKCVEAARKYGRIVQAGTQQRSDPALITAAAQIRDKKLGDVEWIHSLWYRYRKPIGKVTQPTSIPNHIDYNLWCGPGPDGPLMREKLHYDWHWIWAYGNGDMGNIAPHNSDDIRHLLGMTDVPKRVMSVGGRFGWDDDGETPNTMFSVYDYDVPIVLEIRDLPHDFQNQGRRGESVYRRFGKGVKFTNIVKCTDGFYNVTRGGGYSYDNDGNRIEQIKGDGGEQHAANFIAACRSRKHTDLNADILDGHLGSVMIHQANASYLVGKRSNMAEIHARVQDTEEALETLNQMKGHLKLNKIDLNKEKPILGPWLTYDNVSEQFVGKKSKKANKLLKANYRAPFVVPEKV